MLHDQHTQHASNNLVSDLPDEPSSYDQDVRIKLDRVPEVSKTTEQTKKRGKLAQLLVGDLTLPQVIATALTAATSFALSSRIGLAGSIIGVVIGSVASTVASQFYKNLLNTSAKKIKSTLGNTPNSASGSAPGNNIDENAASDSADGRSLNDSFCSTSSGAETKIAERKRKRRQRTFLLFAALVGIAVVLVWAIIVSLATQGQGIRISSLEDERQQVLDSNHPQAESASRPTSEETGDSDASNSETSDTTTDDASDDTKADSDVDDGVTTSGSDASGSNSSNDGGQADSSTDGSNSSGTTDQVDGSGSKTSADAGSEDGLESGSSSESSTGAGTDVGSGVSGNQ